MTKALIIAFTISFILGFTGTAQEWRDSLNVARNAYSNKNYKEAYRYYKSAQKKAPKGVNLANEIGQTAYRLGEFQAAANWLTKSKVTEHAQGKVFHNLGNSHMQKKEYSQAISAYKKALRKNPTNEKTRYNLSEAIRKLKEQQKSKDKKNKPNQNPPKDKQNPPKKDKNPNDSKDRKDSKGDQSGARLQNKSIERLLDKLTRAEAATMKKINKGKEAYGKVSSGKDW
jgi:Ca-activated chloride channel family protein